MNEIIRNMLERRSIRKYKPDQISEEALQSILQAGLYAPCAGSRQSAIFVVCQDEKINDHLGRTNRNAFKGNTSKGNVYVSKDQPSIADDGSIPSGFYGAPTVVTLFAPNFQFAVHDCAVAAENMMLAAHSLGIGSCMIGRAEASFTDEYGQTLLKEWSVGEGTAPRIHVILGYADNGMATAKPRKENRVLRIK